ncbi:unnamed protein product [Protopolystoma xenopodis]|uniref:Uncharacterized protein n=1 Tax=Protopolystoma xenopodis TaxID=117903 RepID=A0A448X4E5_9PLAT|nr:unnamed protein product [Protopolystoma xenopodis]
MATVSPSDLTLIGIEKIGHQILLMGRIRHMLNEFSSFDNENLQVLLFRVSRTIAYIVVTIEKMLKMYERQQEKNSDTYPGIQNDFNDLATQVIRGVLKLMTAVIHVALPPFSSLPDMVVLRQFLLERVMLTNRAAQLAIGSYNINTFLEIRNQVKFACFYLYIQAKGVFDRLEEVNQTCEDSILLTPCGFEMVQIRKPDSDEFVSYPILLY